MSNNFKTSLSAKDKKEQKKVYQYSFAGLAFLALTIFLFFYIAKLENWYKMTSSCGHTSWLGFFFLGGLFIAAAITFEVLALCRRRNLLSICFLVAIVIAIITMLIIYANMNSTLSGC